MTERITGVSQSPSEAGDVLTDILREGARKLLAQAIEARGAGLDRQSRPAR